MESPISNALQYKPTKIAQSSKPTKWSPLLNAIDAELTDTIEQAAPTMDINPNLNPSSNAKNNHPTPMINELLPEPSIEQLTCNPFDSQHFESPTNAKGLIVAIMGTPNAGKSTLLNHLIGQRISAVSTKPQTTRAQTLGVLTWNNQYQVLFVDTPGIVVTREHLNKTKQDFDSIDIGKSDGSIGGNRQDRRISRDISRSSWQSMGMVDCIWYVVDVSRLDFSADKEILAKIAKEHWSVPVHLLLNKIDLASSKKVEQVSLLLSNYFSEQKIKHESSARTENSDKSKSTDASIAQNTDASIAQRADASIAQNEDESSVTSSESIDASNSTPAPLVSFASCNKIVACYDDTLPPLRNLLESLAKPQPWLYHPECKNPSSLVDLIKECIRDKIFKRLNQEIPYSVDIDVIGLLDDPKVLKVQVDLTVLRPSQKVILIGREGEVLKYIKGSSTLELKNALGKRVELTLWIRTKHKK